MTNNIAVLLSAYNGELYITKQIDSILKQEGVSLDIIVRNDGSTDKTKEIIHAYAKTRNNITIIDGVNIGFVKSFTKLVTYALTFEKYDYLCFADQDDIWYENKLQIAINVLCRKDKNLPLLFCSNSDTIDSKDKITGIYRSIEPNWSNGNPLYIPTIQGCAMVFNRKAAELYAMNPPLLSWHDHWMFMICHFMGSVSYEKKSLFAYRIHDNSTLGNVKKENFATRILFWFKPFKSKEICMAKEFLNAYYSILSSDVRKIIKAFTEYQSSVHAKWYMLTSGKYTPSYPNPSFRQIVSLKLRIVANKL